MSYVIHWFVAAVGLVVAAYIVPGIDRGDLSSVLIVAVVLGVVNMLVKPVLKLLALPLVPITLGAILLVINIVCFWLASWIAGRWFDSDFHVDGILPAIGGALIVSVVTFIAYKVLPD